MTPDSVLDLFWDALGDTAPMVPFLFVLYLALEVVARGGGGRLAALARRAGGIGPVLGAVLGVVPQCGMSVFITSLFLSGRVSRGTLVATYIATSDEALPVLIAHGGQGQLVLAVVLGKLVLGALAGLALDAVRPGQPAAAALHGEPPAAARPCGVTHATNYGKLARHALGRTLSIFLWVFAFTLAIGIAIAWTDATSWLSAAREHRYAGVVLTGMFGLIPNCAASIAIAEGAIRGLLPFGATMAGLSAGAGYGPVLLMRDGAPRIAVDLLLTCLGISIAAGLALTAAGW